MMWDMNHGSDGSRGGPRLLLLVAAGALLCAPPANGQPRAAGSLPPTERQVHLMEQALEQAVRRGVDAVEERLPAPLPGVVFFAGTIRARGFVVDGYGLFFDVEFPMVRRSMLWSIGAIGQLDGGMAQSLANLRRRVLEMPPGTARSALEQALRELELRTRSQSPPANAETGVGDSARGRTGSGAPARAADLEEFYRTALEGELADALVAHGGTLPPGALADGEWLTVAARDGRRSAAGAGVRRTLQLRILGGHLSALRDGRLSVEDTRARIETR